MYYVKDENGNRVEAYTKEEFLTFLQNAIDTGSLAGIDADSAIVSKLRCCVSKDTYPIAFVTQAKYNELKSTNGLVNNCYYFIIDDETESNIEARIENLNNEMTGLNNEMAGVKERLDNLGFKEGSLVLSSNITATLNELKRQGNYVLGHLKIKFTGSSYNYYTLTLPKGFEMKSGVIMSFAFISTENYTDKLTGYLKNSSTDVNLFSPTWGSKFTPDEEVEVFFGYEAEPINQEE